MKEGYKDTPIGMIPEEWEVLKIGDIAITFAGGTPNRNIKDYFNGFIPWVKSGEVNNRNIHRTDEFITERAIKETATRIINPNSVLVALYGATVGNVGMLRIEACSNQAVLAVNSKTNSVTNDFIYYWLKQTTKKLISLTQGSGQPNLSKEIVDTLNIPIPTFLEQSAITSILSTVDDKIDAINERITQTQQLKNGLMQQLLTKGIGHTKFKDSPLGKIPESWEVVKLGSLGDFSKGKGILKSELSVTGIPCIRYGEIYTAHDFVIKKFYSFISHEIAKQSVRIKKNDILFAGSGETVEDIGKAVAFIGVEEVYAGGDTIIFRPTNANSVFLSYCLNSRIVIDQRSRFGQGHSVVHIYARDLSEILIPRPPSTEQNKIAEAFTEVDEKLEILRIKKNEYEQLKKGLMQQLLTGNIRVKV